MESRSPRTKRQTHRKGIAIYHRLSEDYLTHYRPELKADLIRAQALQTYLESQAEAMLEARKQIIDHRCENEPGLSQLQREMTADQAVREMFLTIQ